MNREKFDLGGALCGRAACKVGGPERLRCKHPCFCGRPHLCLSSSSSAISESRLSTISSISLKIWASFATSSLVLFASRNNTITYNEFICNTMHHLLTFLENIFKSILPWYRPGSMFLNIMLQAPIGRFPLESELKLPLFSGFTASLLNWLCWFL